MAVRKNSKPYIVNSAFVFDLVKGNIEGIVGCEGSCFSALHSSHRAATFEGSDDRGSMTSSPGSHPRAIEVQETIDRARAAWAAGRADEAEMACRQVLAVWPGQTDAAYLLGLMAYTYGNLDLAI